MAKKKDTWILWSKVLVACLPAAVIGLKFDDYLDAHFITFNSIDYVNCLWDCFYYH